MSIKDFYLYAYPTDELGEELNGGATWGGLWAAIRGGIVYEYLGVGDSLVRERVFSKFAEITHHDYDYIYTEWLNSPL
jgi:hypothetical protein